MQKKLVGKVIFIIAVCASLCVSFLLMKISYHSFYYRQLINPDLKEQFYENTLSKSNSIYVIFTMFSPIVIPLFVLSIYFSLKYFNKIEKKYLLSIFIFVSLLTFLFFSYCIYIVWHYGIHYGESYMQKPFYITLKWFLDIYCKLSIILLPLLIFTTKYSILYLVSKRKNSNFYRNKLETKKRKIEEKLKELQ